MKIIFASFQGFDKNNNPQGMVKIISKILKYFKYDYNYYVSYGNNKLNSKIKTINFFYRFLIQIISKFQGILKRIGIDLHYGKIRLIQEQLFDYYFSFKIQNRTILISTSYIPRTFIKNKKLGGINIFIAGNAYDRYINNLLLNQSNLYGTEIKDAYTFISRLRFIDQHLANTDSIIANTSIVYEIYQNSFPLISTELCEYHINVKDYMIDESFIKNRELTFCYIAHTVWLKGLIYLLEAFNKFDSNELQLIIGGTINKQVQKTIDKMKLNQNIKFIGHVPDLNQFMRSSHVCIVPSLVDNHPTTISEALYCGLPVITTQGCGSKILIKDGENGFIVPIADSEAIAQKIQWFIDNQDKIGEMSTKAKQSIEDIENSDQDEILANHIMKVIEKLKKEKGFA